MEKSEIDDWNPVIEDDGRFREPYPGNRVVTGFITAEGIDLQKDIVHQGAVLPNMPMISKYAVISFKHGVGERGEPDFIPMGRIIKWRKVNDGIEARVSVYPPEFSELVNKCWDDVKLWGPRAGFSLGGRAREKICSGGICNILKADVVEIAMTPSPAHPRAIFTNVSMAKTMDQDIVMKNLARFENASDAVASCGTCSAYADYLVKEEGRTFASALNKLQTMIDNLRKTEGGHTLVKAKDEKDEGDKPKDEKDDAKEETNVEKTSEAPVTSKEGTPAQPVANDGAFVKQMDSVMKAISELTDRVSKMEAKLEKNALRKDEADSTPPPPGPTPAQEPKMDEKAAIEYLLKNGYKVEGKNVGSTPIPPVSQPTGLKDVTGPLTQKSKQRADFESAIEAMKGKC